MDPMANVGKYTSPMHGMGMAVKKKIHPNSSKFPNISSNKKGMKQSVTVTDPENHSSLHLSEIHVRMSTPLSDATNTMNGFK